MVNRPGIAVDPFKTFMNAERYRLADSILRLDQHRALFSAVASPAMVLSAFASELYLKCILTIETGQPIDPSHDLHNLFRKISLKSRKRLQSLWADDVLTEQNQRMRKAVKATTGDDVPTDLAWALENGANAFTQLRYIHENNGQGTSFILGNLPDMLRLVVLELKPEWIGIVHGVPKLIEGID
ncbi:hypothetical protein [Bradyrhizobium japonicum]|uniref:hypothetical protein n=1 Tax=Bradyrhizobium japonicum TaxID=375 RepID=UPI003514063E